MWEILIAIIVMVGLASLFAVVLAVFTKVFYIKIDPKLEKVREVLPGANCGGCGYPGCDAFAEALLKGNASPNDCSAVGEEAVKQIAEILGVTVEKKEKMIARILCQGDKEKVKTRYIYYGLKDCRAVALPNMPFWGGPKACPFSCTGFGGCARACPFGVISMGESGLPQINEEECTGCGKCVEACPKGIIELMPVSRKTYVPCKSEYRGKAVKILCEAGCIGCGLCAKKCPERAIEVENNLPKIDYTKCSECGQCAEKCPTKTIKIIGE